MSNYNYRRKKQQGRKKLKDTSDQGNVQRRSMNTRRRVKNNQGSNGMYNIKLVKNAPIQVRQIRYHTTVLADHSILVSDLMQWVGFATTTTAGYSLVESFRIRRIRFTLLPSETQVPDTATFKWAGTNTPHDEVVVTNMPAVPGTVVLYPPPDSNASWWQSTYADSTPLFTFDETNQSYAQLDIEFEWVMLADNTSNALTALIGATANTIVYPTMPRSTVIWTPQGLPRG